MKAQILQFPTNKQACQCGICRLNRGLNPLSKKQYKQWLRTTEEEFDAEFSELFQLEREP